MTYMHIAILVCGWQKIFVVTSVDEHLALRALLFFTVSFTCN